MPIGSLVAFAVVVVLWVATSLVLRHSLADSPIRSGSDVSANGS